jgi:DNA-directed RNA polymerase specialized sigma24 family protein
MASEGSVTRVLGQLQAGDRAAVEQLWQRYFHRLVGLARTRLPGAVRRVVDGEDVALSAFASFCRCAEQGRFPQLLDRDSLWRLLVVITDHKASHRVRDGTCPKRGGGAVVSLPVADSEEENALLSQVLSREPTPELAAQMAEDYQRLLDALPDDALRTVAVLKMEGYSNAEIAARLEVVDRTVKRRLQAIRSCWSEDEGVS